MLFDATVIFEMSEILNTGLDREVCLANASEM